MKLRRDVKNIVGRRFGRDGRLFVIEYTGRQHYPNAKPHLRVRVWCTACGKLFVTTAHHLRAGRVDGCPRCSRIVGADKVSVLLSNGKTIAQVARESGVKLDTVYHRYVRGWPEADLGEPLRYVRTKRRGRP